MIDDGCDAWFELPPPPTMRVWAKSGSELPAVFDWEVRELKGYKPHYLAIEDAKREGFERAMVVVK